MPRGSIDLALRDLDNAIGLDGDGDGLITWGELRDRHPAIDAYLGSRLRFRTAAEACALRPEEHLVDAHTDGAYAVVRFALACPAPGDAITIRYDLFFDLDPTHRGLVTVDAGGRLTTAILSPESPEVRIEPEAPPGAAVVAFYRSGARHLLFGPDHLLFLIILLLPAAYRRAGGTWQPVEALAPAALDLVKLLTAFTLAHGLSLAAAVTGLVDLPERLVESAIALTIALAALDNLRPYFHGPRWRLAFGFGLIHGLGFASALGPMDLPALDLAVALLAFNLGIETAQLGVALLVLAAAFPLRTLTLYAKGLLPAGSAAALLVASLWFVDRAFALAPP